MIKRILSIGVLVVLIAACVFAQNTTRPINMQYDAEGTGNVLTMPFTEYWWAGICAGGSSGGYEDGGWFTGSSNTPTFNCHEGSNTVYTTQEFSDGGTAWMQRIVPLPSDWTGTLAMKIFWQTSATSGNVVWQVSTKCYADGETTDSAFNSAQTVTDAAKAGASQLNVATFSSLTTTGCAAGEMLFLKILRDPTNGSDTIGASAGFVGAEFTYKRAI